MALAWPTVWDAWQINRAGTLLNRAIVMGADAAAQAGATDDNGKAGVATSAGTAGSSGNAAVVTAGGDYLLSPEAEALLQQSLALMDSASSRGPHTASREIPIWRTYGAAARLLPSEHAFELLLRSRNAARLDWLGELWLGEVASATGHWDEATQAYRRVDVSNLLVYRAEAHVQAGEQELALHELALAKISLDAQADREKAELLLLDRTGDQPSTLAGMMQRPAERATTLSRIGHGLLSLGRPAEAQSVLEQGLAVATMSSPGVTIERNLRFDLAAAIAQTLPDNPPETTAGPGYSYYPAPLEMTRLKAIIRVRALVYQALAFERTGVTCTIGGNILLKVGDEVLGMSLLTEATRLSPTLPDAYVALGDWYDGHGMAYVARSLYAGAAAAMPEQPVIVAALAISTFKTLSHQDALPLLERAAALKTTNPWVFALLGDCYQELGRTVDAKAAWEEGLRLVPGAQPLTARLAIFDQAPGAPK